MDTPLQNSDGTQKKREEGAGNWAGDFRGLVGTGTVFESAADKNMPCAQKTDGWQCIRKKKAYRRAGGWELV